MSRISLQRAHGLKPATVKKRVELLAKQLQHEYGGDYRWDANVLRYSYKGGIDADLTLNDGSVAIDVRLGLMTRMLKGTIERHMNKYLDQYLED